MFRFKISEVLTNNYKCSLRQDVPFFNIKNFSYPIILKNILFFRCSIFSTNYFYNLSKIIFIISLDYFAIKNGHFTKNADEKLSSFQIRFFRAKMADFTKNVIFVKNFELTCLCHIQKKNKNLPHFFCLLFFFPTSKNRQKSTKIRNVRLQSSKMTLDLYQICLPKIPTAVIPLYKSDEKSRSSKTLNFEILFLKFFSSKIFM